jgi:hypothetical protein
LETWKLLPEGVSEAGEGEAAGGEAAGVSSGEVSEVGVSAAGVEVAGGGVVVLLEPLDTPTPGSETMVLSCSPSGILPPGFAGHEPGGDTGEERANGIVPSPV